MKLQDALIKNVFKSFICSVLFIFVLGNIAIAEDKGQIPSSIENLSEKNNIDTNQEKLVNVKKIVNEKNISEKSNIINKDNVDDPINMYGIKMLKSLGIVIGGLLIILAVVKRTAGIKNPIQKINNIQIIERKSLNTKSQLILAKVESQKVLIGLSGDGICMLNIDEKKNFDDLLNNKFDIQEKEEVCINVEQKKAE